MKSAVKIVLLFVTLVLITAGLSIYWTFYQTVPSPDRTVNLKGLQSEVTIFYDEYMVPHVSAEQDVDAFMAKGYLHARDRLWQMTLQQYKLEGLHSREIDKSLLELDRFYLTLAFGSFARQTYEQLPDHDRELLEAYAEGVNHYIRENTKHLPVQFTLSDAHPVEWEPWHAIGVQLLWAWEYQHAFWSKPALSSIHAQMDDRITQILTGRDIPHSSYFGNAPPLPDSASRTQLVDHFRNFTEPVQPDRVIRSGTGFAVARNQPESLAVLSVSRESRLSLPDQGYEMTIEIGDHRRTGITIPGFPVMVTGQNRSTAWSLQPLAVDDGMFFTGELFREPMQVPVDWQKDPAVYDHITDEIELKRHFITLKDSSEYQMVMLRANDLPVVSLSEETNSYLAFEWSGFTSEADFGAYLNLARARSAEELERAVAGIRTPAVQVLFTTDDNHAGRLIGGMMLRSSHPFKIHAIQERVDRVPASGYYRDDIRTDGTPVYFLEHFAGTDNHTPARDLFFYPWDRSQRYHSLWQQTPAGELEYEISNNWHRDIYSPFAAGLTPAITQSLSKAKPDSVIAILLPYLENWDYEYRSNETAATLFEVFLHQSAHNLYRIFLNEDEFKPLFITPQIPISAVTRLLDNPALWPEPLAITFQEWIIHSMKDTAGLLTEYFGEEPMEWQWANVFRGTFQPVLFEKTKNTSLSARLAERNLINPGFFSVTGAPHTIQASHMHFYSPDRLAGATTMKRNMFLSPDMKNFAILSTGQSGNIFADHFDDQFYLWKEGILKENAFEIPQSQHSHNHTQRLIP